MSFSRRTASGTASEICFLPYRNMIWGSLPELPIFITDTRYLHNEYRALPSALSSLRHKVGRRKLHGRKEALVFCAALIVIRLPLIKELARASSTRRP
jgi:hypothetical protein